MKKLIKVKVDWYQRLLDDLRLLNFEGIVRTKHAIGKRILKDELKFERAEYGKKTIINLSEVLEVDFSDLKRCIQFARKYPDLEKVTTGRLFSWRYIRQNLLPEIPHIARSTGEDEWDTPSEFIQSAKEVMGKINVDPASSKRANERIQADKFYTAKESGLDKEWEGNVWMNPPYAQPLVASFCKKLIEKYESNEINQACVLVNNATETTWFQEMLRRCKCVCFPKGRIKFIDKEGNPLSSPLQGQAILYFGKRENEFAKEFSKFGFILWRK